MKTLIPAFAMALVSSLAHAELPEVRGQLISDSPESQQIRLIVSDDNPSGQDPACTGFLQSKTADVKSDGSYTLPAVSVSGSSCPSVSLSVGVIDKLSGKQNGPSIFGASFSPGDENLIVKSYIENARRIRQTQVINPTQLTIGAGGMTLQQWVNFIVSKNPFLKEQFQHHKNVTWEIGLYNSDVSTYYGTVGGGQFFKDSNTKFNNDDCSCVAKSSDGNKKFVSSFIPAEIGFVSDALLNQGQHQYFAHRIQALTTRSLILRFRTPPNESSINTFLTFDNLPNIDLNNPITNDIIIDLMSLIPVEHF